MALNLTQSYQSFLLACTQALDLHSYYNPGSSDTKHFRALLSTTKHFHCPSTAEHYTALSSNAGSALHSTSKHCWAGTSQHLQALLSTTQHFRALLSTTQHFHWSTAEYYTALPSTAEHYTALPSTAEHYTARSSTAEHYTVLPMQALEIYVEALDLHYTTADSWPN